MNGKYYGILAPSGKAARRKCNHIQCGSVSWTKSELISRKIRIRILNFVHVFPPASVPLRRTKQKFFLYIFNYAHPKKFLIRKRKCFCFVFLLIREKRKRSILNRKRAKIPSPDPLPFCPFAFRASPDFSAGLQNQRISVRAKFS